MKAILIFSYIQNTKFQGMNWGDEFEIVLVELKIETKMWMYVVSNLGKNVVRDSLTEQTVTLARLWYFNWKHLS